MSHDSGCNVCVKGKAWILDQQMLTYGLFFTALMGALGQVVKTMMKNGLKICCRCYRR